MLLYYHKMDEISRLFMKSVRGYNDLLFERGADVEWTVTGWMYYKAKIN